MSRSASPGRAIAAMTLVELRLVVRRPENLFATIVIPTLVLVLFSSVAVIDLPGPRPVEFLLPGSIALAIIATSLVSLGITTAYDRTYGVLKRLGGSPLSRPELIVARILTVLVVEAVQVGLLIGTAVVILGWSPPGTVSVPLLIGGVVLGTLTFAGLGLLLAGILRGETMLAVANLLFLAFLALGGIIVPVDRLPAPVAAIGHALPAAALSDVLRAALGSIAAGPVAGAAGADTLSSGILLAVWGALAVGLAAVTFRWE